MAGQKQERTRSKNPQEAARLAEERARQGQQAYRAAPKPAPVAITYEEIRQAIYAGNEVADAGFVVKALSGRYAFDKQRGFMFAFNGGGYWQKDVLENAKAEANRFLVGTFAAESGRQNTLSSDPASSEDDRKQAAALRDRINKRIQAVNAHRRMESIMRIACTGKDSLAITGDEWNRDPWELGALGQVIDLKTGQARQGKPEDYINKVAPTDWKGLHTAAPTWDAFLHSTFGESQELVSYVQKVFGSAIVGLAKQAEFYVLWGEGRNGKGTMIETLKKVLGDLVGPIQSEMIMGLKPAGSSAASPEILDLQGKRMVWASETREGQRLNVEKIKLFTGGDTLTARYNYSNDLISFTPSHTLFLLTNHKPRVGAGEYALWRRLRLIPFNFSFVDDPQAPHERPRDPDLPDKLEDERSGILAWLVRGCLDWQAEGLAPPAEVLEATEKYEQAEDVIAQFITARCRVGRNLRQQAGPFVDAFAEWFKEENGAQAKPFGGKKFREHMEKKGFKVDETGRHNHYTGIALRDDD